jgi:hypothetical protein
VERLREGKKRGPPGDKRLAESQAEADRVIADMLDLGAPRNEVADRLGIPNCDVKKDPTARKAAASSTTPEPSSDSVEVTASEHMGLLHG